MSSNTVNVEIKNRWTGDVIFTAAVSVSIDEKWRLRAAVEMAVKARVSLNDAQLNDAQLNDAQLNRAELNGAELNRAQLNRAELNGAELNRAELNRAELNGAELNRAELNRAQLNDAQLNRAELNGAELNRAELNRAELNGAELNRAELNRAQLNDAQLNGASGLSADAPVLRSIKADLWEILHHAKNEVPALLTALREGRINGSTYSGTCACLVGTIANARGTPLSNGDRSGLDGIPQDASRPAECWFLAINTGDTPETNLAAKFAEAWIVEFMALAAMEVA